jgi:hypothetical protein
MRIVISLLSQMLNMSKWGCRLLMKRLSIPIDIEDDHPLALSVMLAVQNKLKPIYSINNLALKMGHDKKTILTILRKAKVPLIETKRKRYVYLSDIAKLQEKINEEPNKFWHTNRNARRNKPNCYVANDIYI